MHFDHADARLRRARLDEDPLDRSDERERGALLLRVAHAQRRADDAALLLQSALWCDAQASAARCAAGLARELQHLVEAVVSPWRSGYWAAAAVEPQRERGVQRERRRGQQAHHAGERARARREEIQVTRGRAVVPGERRSSGDDHKI